MHKSQNVPPQDFEKCYFEYTNLICSQLNEFNVIVMGKIQTEI